MSMLTRPSSLQRPHEHISKHRQHQTRHPRELQAESLALVSNVAGQCHRPAPREPPRSKHNDRNGYDRQGGAKGWLNHRIHLCATGLSKITLLQYVFVQHPEFVNQYGYDINTASCCSYTKPRVYDYDRQPSTHLRICFTDKSLVVRTSNPLGSRHHNRRDSSSEI